MALLSSSLDSWNVFSRVNYWNIRPHRVKSSPFCVTMCSVEKSKRVWIWTENQQVMTAAVERGWNTFVFMSQNHQLAKDWSTIALIDPLFVKEGEVFDGMEKRVASICQVATPQELQKLQPSDEQADNIVIDLLDWQALEQGLGGVVLKVEDDEAVLELKEYFDRRNEVSNLLSLTKATVTRVNVIGMGDRVCVDLCSLMRPGEGLLVGSFARGLFLVHSECLESNYIASRPFRINAGPVHSYVLVPGGKTCYLSELKSGKEVIVVDQKGQQRTAIVGRVKIESRPLILVEAKGSDHQTHYSIILQNAETVALIAPFQENGGKKTTIPVTSLKMGDEVLLRVQGGARHTGIEIREFIVEN
ncbi:3-dehydroquinate synthase homolog isoform X2 [Mangifera indica]|uniref:3-dehydroquinate synthase homolog isoform X2 n=1 Tax=Mangifera indica TaxID=29780 RepID=UPI001CFB020C|nr:3-dehydroquinate synthase homolog isoform X2 [Mangifera indica]